MDHIDADSANDAAPTTSLPVQQAEAPVAPGPSFDADAAPTIADNDDEPLGSGAPRDPSKRRRGSRGGQRRRGAGGSGTRGTVPTTTPTTRSTARRPTMPCPAPIVDTPAAATSAADDVEMPEPMSEGRPSVEAAERALVRRPQIGDTMPIPTSPPPGPAVRATPENDTLGEPPAPSQAQWRFRRRRKRGLGPAPR